MWNDLHYGEILQNLTDWFTHYSFLKELETSDGAKSTTPPELLFQKFEEWVQSNEQIYNLQSSILDLEAQKVRQDIYLFSMIWFVYVCGEEGAFSQCSLYLLPNSMKEPLCEVMQAMKSCNMLWNINKLLHCKLESKYCLYYHPACNTIFIVAE